MVVSNENIDSLIESYLFFRDNGVNFSLNLYIEQKNNQKSILRLDENHSIYKLCELFDYWATDKFGKIHISYFKNILDFILFNKKYICTFTSCLGRWIGVHFDGSLAPCNRYFPEEYRFGNVYDYSDIDKVFESTGFTNLLQKAIQRREKCKSCEIYDFCCGGCNNVALNENGIENNGGISCKILIEIYRHIDCFITRVYKNRFNEEYYNPILVEMINKASQLNCRL